MHPNRQRKQTCKVNGREAGKRSQYCAPLPALVWPRPIWRLKDPWVILAPRITPEQRKLGRDLWEQHKLGPLL